jgi:murein DD-endopeptidase MepM/ murein hydrolase activator NlpD
MRRLARMAGKAVKLIVRGIAKIIGVPVLTTTLILLAGIIVILSFWGAMPYEAQAAPEKTAYEQAAEESFPGVKSEDGAELEHKLTWGILAAVDYMGGAAMGENKPQNTASKTAEIITPQFEYKDSTITTTRTVTKTVTQDDGTTKKVTTTETDTRDIKLLVRADTYRGVYSYIYLWVTVHEGGATIKKEVQDAVTHTPNWSRLSNALRQRIHEDNELPIEEAIACYNLGLAFDSGQENLAWLGDEEDAWAAGAAGDWESDSSLPAPTGEFIWPVQGRVTSPFGERLHPVYSERRPHNGIDIAVSQGTPVKATADGLIRFADWQGGFGKLVVIDHGGNVLSLYGHLMGFEVRAGDKVQKGNVVAYSGSTGVSTGPHLHFEIRVNGTPVSPTEIIANQTNKLSTKGG